MPDLNVVALIPAKPGSEQVVRDVLLTLAAATQDHEGCLSYETFESAVAPGTFVTVERWRARQDHDAHMAGQDVADAFAAADGHLAGDVAVHPLHPTSS